MGLLFQPHRDRREPLWELGRNAGTLLGMMGWLTVAMGLASTAIPFFLALPGGLAALLQTRFFRVTGGVEVVGFAMLLAAVPHEALPWIWTGLVTSFIGRAIAIVILAKST